MEPARLIELLVCWQGQFTRKDLMDYFSIGETQASNYIRDYKNSTQEQPVIIYDSRAKAYVLRHDAAPFSQISSNVDDFLSYLSHRNSTHIVSPDFGIVNQLNLPKRKVSEAIFRKLMTAIRTQSRVEVDYISLKSPDREGRIIVPHSFVNTGLRWHLRAFCEKDKMYKDFVLSRFKGLAEVIGSSSHSKEADVGWNTEVTLIFEPDMRLSQAQSQVVIDDYQMENGQLRIVTRGCLVQYILKALQISIHTLSGTPEAQQLMLINQNDIKQWLF